MDEKEIIRCLRLVAERYDYEFAATIERLFRNETRHFKSGNFLITFSPGMEAFSDLLPYGWSSLKNFWDINKNLAPIGIYKQVENTSALLKSRGERKFIKFPTLEASMLSVAFLINSRGGNGGSWFSIQQSAIDAYNKELSKIIPRYINLIKPKQ